MVTQTDASHADAGLEYHQWLAEARHDRPQ
jgi:hypothetical protein